MVVRVVVVFVVISFNEHGFIDREDDISSDLLHNDRLVFD